jgi:hypothetical protein
MRDIWKERRLIDKERRDLINELMKPHEEFFRERLKEVMAVCEEQGHNFKFSNFGPLGHAWYHCSKCGKSKVEND